MKADNFLLIRIRALEARIIALETMCHAMEMRPQLRRKDLAQKFGVTVRSINRAINDGRLPKPTYHFGPLWTPAALEGISLR